MPDFVALLAVLGTFGIPMLIIWTAHKRRMLELELTLKSRSTESVQAAIEQLRSEMRSLRDTTTQYDMSFDTALQRVERRIDTMENHAIAVRAEQSRNVELHTGR